MVKQQIKRIIRSISRPVFKNDLQALLSTSVAYQRMVEHYERCSVMPASSCEGIVFSRDRAMQLHALISSFFAYVKNPVPLSILYTCSNKEHYNSYEELKEIFSYKNISFIEEKEFKKDLEMMLRSISSTLLFFMTDDGLFIDYFDIQQVTVFNPIFVLPSLIKGKDLTYCYLGNRHQSLPEFIQPDFALPPGMMCWEWSNAAEGSDWAYPMSLDLTFYKKSEIEMLIRNVSYKAPNSLENALHVNYAPIFLQRKGVCFEKAKYVNIVCNIVNREHKNRHTGLHSAESLLRKWQEGYRIQYELFYGRTSAEAEISQFSFAKR